MFLWHKWTKWEEYVREGTIQQHPFSKEMIPFVELRQKRYCEKCGKKQDIKVQK